MVTGRNGIADLGLHLACSDLVIVFLYAVFFYSSLCRNESNDETF